MNKTRWTRNVAVFGTAVTLSLACYTTSGDDVSAATFCQETEMAGLSLSLDKYYVDNYVDTQENTADSTAAAPVSPTAAPSQPAVTKTEEQRKEETVAKQFRNLGISTASNYVNIRKHPTTDSKILGKLYKGGSAEIIGEKNGWVKIESGSVTGYIRKDLLAIGKEAQNLAGKYGTAFAFVKSGVVTLNVRSAKSTKSSIITQIPEDEKYEIVGESDNWYKILIDDGDKGYVAKEFVRTRVRFDKAISIKEEKEKLRRQREAERAEQERLAALAARRSCSARSASLWQHWLRRMHRQVLQVLLVPQVPLAVPVRQAALPEVPPAVLPEAPPAVLPGVLPGVLPAVQGVLLPAANLTHHPVLPVQRLLLMHVSLSVTHMCGVVQA